MSQCVTLARIHFNNKIMNYFFFFFCETLKERCTGMSIFSTVKNFLNKKQSLVEKKQSFVEKLTSVTSGGMVILTRFLKN